MGKARRRWWFPVRYGAFASGASPSVSQFNAFYPPYGPANTNSRSFPEIFGLQDQQTRRRQTSDTALLTASRALLQRCISLQPYSPEH
ncbi:hypothetical protein L218DRAFT_111990 [Marasmius fiardii PR-910]|nr:hypothetical protein L218DRAFT_111990 [Marasmius fiardii PR-910]